jgi:hypothetical protein
MTFPTLVVYVMVLGIADKVDISPVYWGLAFVLIAADLFTDWLRRRDRRRRRAA